MLIEADARALEWMVVVFNSQDKVGLEELWKGVDIHSANRDMYGFPKGDEGRQLAKTFLYRMIYRGPAYAYSVDPRFMGVSSKEKFWQNIIDMTYEKYADLARWHQKIIQEVNATGKLTTQTGRTYEFKRNYKGEYSEYDISNYPVQGLGAELMAVARVTAYSRYRTYHHRNRFLFCNTVHDSMVLDADVKNGSQELFDICCWLEDIFTDIPKNFEKVFNVPVNIPLAGECKYGVRWDKDTMVKFDRNNFELK